jgi:hypothetical protein
MGMAEGEGVRVIRICYVMLSNRGTALRQTSLLSHKQREGRCGMLVNIFLFNLPAICCIFVVAAAAAASSFEQTQVKR